MLFIRLEQSRIPSANGSLFVKTILVGIFDLLLTFVNDRMLQSRYKKAAEALFNAKLLMKTDDFNISFDLAYCNAKIKENVMAEESCREALKICKSEETYKLLTTCLIRQEKISEAIDAFRLALRYTIPAKTIPGS